MTQKKNVMLIGALMLLSTSATAQVETSKARKWHTEIDLRYHHEFFTNSHYDQRFHYFSEEQQTFVDSHWKGSRHAILLDEGFQSSKYGGNDLMIMELYDISRRFTLGAGIGLSHYSKVDNNYIPIYLTAHYKPWSRHPFGYWYTELGLAGGALANLGYGTSIRLKGNTRLDLKVGYNMLCQRSRWTWDGIDSEGQSIYNHYKANIYSHNLQLSVGIVF